MLMVSFIGNHMECGFNCCLCISSIVAGSLLTHTQQISGSWVRGQSAGGCRNNSTYSSNPKFWLKVKEQGEVLISLLQHGPWSSVYNSQKRQSPGNTHQHPYYQAIALHVWKVCGKNYLVSFIAFPYDNLCFILNWSLMSKNIYKCL